MLPSGLKGRLGLSDTYFYKCVSIAFQIRQILDLDALQSP